MNNIPVVTEQGNWKTFTRNGQYITENGNEFWYKLNQFHRVDGPAIIMKDGFKEYWLNGQPYEKEAWWEKLSDEDKLKAVLNGEVL